MFLAPSTLFSTFSMINWPAAGEYTRRVMILVDVRSIGATDLSPTVV